jgi:hypothetical protein
MQTHPEHRVTESHVQLLPVTFTELFEPDALRGFCTLWILINKGKIACMYFPEIIVNNNGIVCPDGIWENTGQAKKQDAYGYII